jgi:hypothetical protein
LGMCGLSSVLRSRGMWLLLLSSFSDMEVSWKGGFDPWTVQCSADHE